MRKPDEVITTEWCIDPDLNIYTDGNFYYRVENNVVQGVSAHREWVERMAQQIRRLEEETQA